jgi:two-component system phosphate regulon response regulator PhoB
VDDEEDVLINMKAFLTRHGYEAATTTSCEQAVKILNDFKPNLIFVDINVGNEDGRQMCLQVKSIAEHRHIPVILISADHDALQLYRDYGADAYIRKPFKQFDFLKTLHQFI